MARRISHDDLQQCRDLSGMRRLIIMQIVVVEPPLAPIGIVGMSTRYPCDVSRDRSGVETVVSGLQSVWNSAGVGRRAMEPGLQVSGEREQGDARVRGRGAASRRE